MRRPPRLMAARRRWTAPFVRGTPDCRAPVQPSAHSYLGTVGLCSRSPWSLSGPPRDPLRIHRARGAHRDCALGGYPLLRPLEVERLRDSRARLVRGRGDSDAHGSNSCCARFLGSMSDPDLVRSTYFEGRAIVAGHSRGACVLRCRWCSFVQRRERADRLRARRWTSGRGGGLRSGDWRFARPRFRWPAGLVAGRIEGCLRAGGNHLCRKRRRQRRSGGRQGLVAVVVAQRRTPCGRPL
jgi:hypothetical protein